MCICSCHGFLVSCLYDLKIITLNVRGLRQSKKRIALFEWLNHKKFDICLQERYCTTNFENSFNKSWNGKVIHSLSNSMHSRGVCTMFSNTVDFEVLKSECDNDGRQLSLKINLNGQMLSIFMPQIVFQKGKASLKS